MGINTQSTGRRALSLFGKINQSCLLGHHIIDPFRQENAPSLYTKNLPIANTPPPCHFTVLGRYLLECGRSRGSSDPFGSFL